MHLSQISLIIILASVLLIAVLQTVNGIYCYKCTSGWVGGDLARESPDCRSKNLAVLRPYKIDCGSPLIFQWCSTMLTASGAFSRGCNLNMTSFGVKTGSCTQSKSKIMCLCDSGLCNNREIIPILASNNDTETLTITNFTTSAEETTTISFTEEVQQLKETTTQSVEITYAPALVHQTNATRKSHSRSLSTIVPLVFKPVRKEISSNSPGAQLVVPDAGLWSIALLICVKAMHCTG